MSNETTVFWEPEAAELQQKDYVFWVGRHDENCEEACRVGEHSVWMGRMTSKITKTGKRKGVVGVIYQHCMLEGTDRVWVDSVYKSRLMRDDVDFVNLVGRVFWGHRADGKHVMGEQVWAEISTRLPSFFQDEE